MISLVINVLAGWLSSLSFAPSLWWITAFVGLSIWHRTIVSANLRAAMLRSLVFYLALSFSTIWWTGIYVGVLAPIAISIYQSALFALIPFVVRLFRSNSAFTYAGLLVMFEWVIRSWPFGGFGWIRFGFTQVNSPLTAFLPFIGVAGLSFLVAIISFKAKSRLILLVLITFLLVNLLPNGTKVQANQTLKIALIQGGVSQLGFDFNKNPTEVFRRHLAQTESSIVKNEVDLIIWPENSVDVDLSSHPEIARDISDLSTKLNTPILVGEVANNGTDATSKKLSNQSILFSPNPQKIYIKRYLTPFGEFIPLRDFFGKFSGYTENVIDFQGGDKAVLFQVKDLNFNSKICYELLSDSQNREVADFSIVQTNNATFGYTKQLEQQLAIAKIRAIESGRYFAYVSTTGITSVIDPNGKVTEFVPKFKAQTLNYEVPKVSGKTIAQRLGFLVEPVILILMLLQALSTRTRISWLRRFRILDKK